jgi:hypothetical protein
MRVLKTTIVSAITLLLLTTAAFPAQAQTLVTETLEYSATSVNLPAVGPLPGGPVAIVGPCDQDGVGAVRFCQAFDDDPKQVMISLRDSFGLRAAGVIEFRDASGGTVTQEFCGTINHPVPQSAGNNKDVIELVVYPAITSAVLADGTLCGASPGTVGTVTAVWRYDN